MTQRTPKKTSSTLMALYHIREILNKHVEIKFNSANSIAEYLNDIEDNL